MLTCSGCGVAKFCSADHQKMATKSVASDGNFSTGRHKDICGLLIHSLKLSQQWRLTCAGLVLPRACTVAQKDCSCDVAYSPGELHAAGHGHTHRESLASIGVCMLTRMMPQVFLTDWPSHPFAKANCSCGAAGRVWHARCNDAITLHFACRPFM
jgi:hypothetical protein